MNTINQNFAQNEELSHDVPVTKSILAHAGIFISIVFVLFLVAEARIIARLAEGRHLSEQTISHTGALAHNHYAGFRKL